VGVRHDPQMRIGRLQDTSQNHEVIRLLVQD
jgi:hypothetical protein